MAVDKIQTNAMIETGTLVNESYGTMVYTYNPRIKLCFVTWNGTGTNAPATVTGYLPSYIKPLTRVVNTVIGGGNYIEAATTGVISVSTASKNWIAGYLSFFTE